MGVVQFPGRNIVCFCEDVTLEEIIEVVDSGITDLQLIKRILGVGTGPCQGKQCMARIAKIVIERANVDPSRMKPPTFRPPARPVPLGVLAHGVLTEE